MNYDALFVNPFGRTSRSQYIPALITVVATMIFFSYLVTGRMAQFCVVTLLYPAFVLLARRLRDMRFPGWLVLIPLVFMLLAFGTLLDYFSFDNHNLLGHAAEDILLWGAITLSAVFALWGCLGASKN